jgi:hypothetical protein
MEQLERIIPFERRRYFVYNTPFCSEFTLTKESCCRIKSFLAQEKFSNFADTESHGSNWVEVRELLL